MPQQAKQCLGCANEVLILASLACNVVVLLISACGAYLDCRVRCVHCDCCNLLGASKIKQFWLELGTNCNSYFCICDIAWTSCLQSVNNALTTIAWLAVGYYYETELLCPSAANHKRCIPPDNRSALRLRLLLNGNANVSRQLLQKVDLACGKVRSRRKQPIELKALAR